MAPLNNLRTVIIGSVLAGTLGLMAAEPGGRHSFRSYGTEQGLDNLAVSSLLQDRHGFIWAGTEEGLFRYDGQRFKSFGLAEGLPSGSVTCLHSAPDGSLWVGTWGGLARLQSSRFQPIPHASGLPAASVADLASGSRGELYVATSQGLFVSGADGNFGRVTGAPRFACSALTLDENQRTLWVAAGCELHEAQPNGQWRVHRLGSESIHAILVDRQRTVWVRTARELWSRVKGSETFALAVKEPISARGGLYPDRSGGFYLTSDLGLRHWDGQTWQKMSIKEGLPTDWTRAVLEDREGNLWVASRGLHRELGQGQWRSHAHPEGFQSEVVRSIFRDRGGQLWAATDRGLHRARADRWEVVPGTEQEAVRGLLQTSSGRIYFGGEPAGIHSLDPRTAQIRRHWLNATSGRINRLAETPDGKLYAATNGSGLLEIQDSASGPKILRVDLPGGHATERFRDLLLDTKGQLWAAGDEGLALRESNGHWIRLTEKDGLKARAVSYLCQRLDGSFWVSFFEPMGVQAFRFRDKRLEILPIPSALDSLAKEKVYLLREDVRRQLWIGTGKGIHVLIQETTQQFGLGDGLVGEDINGSAFWPEPDGGVWIGTSAGLGRYIPSREQNAASTPQTALLSFKIAERSPILGPLYSGTLEVPFRENTVEIRFSGISFRNESRVQHQYCLDGLEDKWHQSLVREARYPALPPGSYTFRVRARLGENQPWGPISAVSFQVQPPWYRTVWFMGLSFLTVAGGLVYGLQRQFRQSQKARAGLEDLVQAKERELAETQAVLKDISYTDSLTGLKNRKYLHAAISNEVAHVLRLHQDILEGRIQRTTGNADLVFMVVDLDMLRFVNQTWGMQAGNEAIRQYSEVLQKSIRQSDSLLRWEEDEFVVLARNANRNEVKVLAERIRRAVEETRFDLGEGHSVRRTCCVGWAPYPFIPERPRLLRWDETLALARRCLLAAKSSGGNASVGLLSGAVIWEDLDFRRSLEEDLPTMLQHGELIAVTHLVEGRSVSWGSDPGLRGRLHLED